MTAITEDGGILTSRTASILGAGLAIADADGENDIAELIMVDLDQTNIVVVGDDVGAAQLRPHLGFLIPGAGE